MERKDRLTDKVTPFGKELRKIRINHDEKQKDMALNLSVSKTFLSYLERGQRKIPSDFTRKIVEIYNLSDNDYESLVRSFYRTEGVIKITLIDKSEEDVTLILKLIQKLDKLSSEDKKEILAILKN